MVPSRNREQNLEQLDRITQDPEVMGGMPCLRGMCVTVGMIIGQIGAGHSVAEILGDYPYLGARGHHPGAVIRGVARKGARSHAVRRMRFLVDMGSPAPGQGIGRSGD